MLLKSSSSSSSPIVVVVVVIAATRTQTFDNCNVSTLPFQIVHHLNCTLPRFIFFLMYFWWCCCCLLPFNIIPPIFITSSVFFLFVCLLSFFSTLVSLENSNVICQAFHKTIKINNRRSNRKKLCMPGLVLLVVAVVAVLVALVWFNSIIDQTNR